MSCRKALTCAPLARLPLSTALPSPALRWQTVLALFALLPCAPSKKLLSCRYTMMLLGAIASRRLHPRQVTRPLRRRDHQRRHHGLFLLLDLPPCHLLSPPVGNPFRQPSPACCRRRTRTWSFYPHLCRHFRRCIPVRSLGLWRARAFPRCVGSLLGSAVVCHHCSWAFCSRPEHS